MALAGEEGGEEGPLPLLRLWSESFPSFQTAEEGVESRREDCVSPSPRALPSLPDAVDDVVHADVPPLDGHADRPVLRHDGVPPSSLHLPRLELFAYHALSAHVEVSSSCVGEGDLSVLCVVGHECFFLVLLLSDLLLFFGSSSGQEEQQETKRATYRIT